MPYLLFYASQTCLCIAVFSLDMVPLAQGWEILNPNYNTIMFDVKKNRILL